MTHDLRHTQREFTHFWLFAGIGGGAEGLNRSHPRFRSLSARFRCLGGIDSDAAACHDFQTRTGAPATQLDLFDREQYTDFHGSPPPPDWREATPEDIRRAAGGEFPDVLCTSPPCKGFSGLLGEKRSKTAKYQALNRLTLRGLMLTLHAFEDDPPALILLENVPRIATRGRRLLDQIKALLSAHGYAVAETEHDCGEIGGLGQRRKRFLLVARHTAKVPPFLYEPPKRRLLSVGDVIGRLPLPGDESIGAMHQLAALQFMTWVRLAFVRAGADWRSLRDYEVVDGYLRNYGLVPLEAGWHNGGYGVGAWDRPAATVTGGHSPACGRTAIADPRTPDYLPDTYGVSGWEETSGTVTGRAQASTGKFSVADPRPEWGAERRGLGVNEWEEPTGVVTGQRSPGQGRFAVADPRLPAESDFHPYGVLAGDEPAGTVTADARPGAGAYSVADPRYDGRGDYGQLGVVPWDRNSGTVKSRSGPGAGAYSVADPRVSGWGGRGKGRVTGFDEPTGTVIAASSTGTGACAVADPRVTNHGEFGNQLRVGPWDENAPTVTGARGPHQGAACIADPRMTDRPNRHRNKNRVGDWEEPATTVIGSTRPASGAACVADPRVERAGGGKGFCNVFRVVRYDETTQAVTGGGGPTAGGQAVADPRVQMSGDRRGPYGVLRYDAPSGSVTGSGRHDNGPHNVADPRLVGGAASDLVLPDPKEQGRWLIVAEDGTYHRPLTTYELAALQGFVDPERLELDLHGSSHSGWRERIGNAIPPATMQAIGEVMGRTLLMAAAGETFVLSAEPVWVKELAAVISLSEVGDV